MWLGAFCVREPNRFTPMCQKTRKFQGFFTQLFSYTSEIKRHIRPHRLREYKLKPDIRFSYHTRLANSLSLTRKGALQQTNVTTKTESRLKPTTSRGSYNQHQKTSEENSEERGPLLCNYSLDYCNLMQLGASDCAVHQHIQWAAVTMWQQPGLATMLK